MGYVYTVSDYGDSPAALLARTWIACNWSRLSPVTVRDGSVIGLLPEEGNVVHRLSACCSQVLAVTHSTCLIW